MRSSVLVLLSLAALLCCVSIVAAQTTTTRPTTTTTTTTLATTTSVTPASNDTTTVTGTATAPVPAERPAEAYLLVLAGSRDDWGKLLNKSSARDELIQALRKDLAGKFYTTWEFVQVLRLWLGSLNVQFSVSPTVDGTQIRDGDFLRGSGKDASWLANTKTVWSTVSSSKLEVQSQGYANSSRTPPPTHSECADGCGGFVAAGASVLLVVCALVVWAWRRHGREQDEMARDKLELEDMGAAPNTAMAPVAIGSPVAAESTMFSNPRSTSVRRV